MQPFRDKLLLEITFLSSVRARHMYGILSAIPFQVSHEVPGMIQKCNTCNRAYGPLFDRFVTANWILVLVIMQGQAELYLERLHGVTEKELEALAREDSKVDMDDWAKFRERLIGLTDVTKSHFEKLVQVCHQHAMFKLK